MSERVQIRPIGLILLLLGELISLKRRLVRIRLRLREFQRAGRGLLLCLGARVLGIARIDVDDAAGIDRDRHVRRRRRGHREQPQIAACLFEIDGAGGDHREFVAVLVSDREFERGALGADSAAAIGQQRHHASADVDGAGGRGVEDRPPGAERDGAIARRLDGSNRHRSLGRGDIDRTVRRRRVENQRASGSSQNIDRNAGADALAIHVIGRAGPDVFPGGQGDLGALHIDQRIAAGVGARTARDDRTTRGDRRGAIRVLDRPEQGDAAVRRVDRDARALRTGEVDVDRQVGQYRVKCKIVERLGFLLALIVSLLSIPGACRPVIDRLEAVARFSDLLGIEDIGRANIITVTIVVAGIRVDVIIQGRGQDLRRSDVRRNRRSGQRSAAEIEEADPAALIERLGRLCLCAPMNRERIALAGLWRVLDRPAGWPAYAGRSALERTDVRVRMVRIRLRRARIDILRPGRDLSVRHGQIGRLEHIGVVVKRIHRAVGPVQIDDVDDASALGRSVDTGDDEIVARQIVDRHGPVISEGADRGRRRAGDMALDCHRPAADSHPIDVDRIRRGIVENRELVVRIFGGRELERLRRRNAACQNCLNLLADGQNSVPDVGRGGIERQRLIRIAGLDVAVDVDIGPGDLDGLARQGGGRAAILALVGCDLRIRSGVGCGLVRAQLVLAGRGVGRQQVGFRVSAGSNQISLNIHIEIGMNILRFYVNLRGRGNDKAVMRGCCERRIGRVDRPVDDHVGLKRLCRLDRAVRHHVRLGRVDDIDHNIRRCARIKRRADITEIPFGGIRALMTYYIALDVNAAGVLGDGDPLYLKRRPGVVGDVDVDVGRGVEGAGSRYRTAIEEDLTGNGVDRLNVNHVDRVLGRNEC